MSQHSSLKSGAGASEHRSVLKRYEKISKLKSSGDWNEDKDSVFKIKKVRQIKYKVKKHESEKDDKTADAESTESKDQS